MERFFDKAFIMQNEIYFYFICGVIIITILICFILAHKEIKDRSSDNVDKGTSDSND